MSHTDESIICPNCGSEAKGNYCYQCGQETHLHKDTFWGLVMHFLGHYFHYDSKFWQTMRTLWREPGKLTQAYMNKQRMRYIPPISLYIFISAVYFLISFSLPHKTIFPIKKDNASLVRQLTHKADSLNRAKAKELTTDTSVEHGTNKNKLNWFIDTAEDKSVLKAVLNERDDSVAVNDTASIDTSYRWLNQYIAGKYRKIEKEHDGHVAKYLLKKLKHNFPKIFFFMIPVLALILKLLYIKRKSVSFADHAVFAIHYHSFWFSLNLLTYIGISEMIDGICELMFYVISFIYMVIALRKIYQSSRRKAIVYTVLVAIGYGFTFAIVASIAIAVFFLTA